MNTRAKKTHCKRGHEFTEENTYIDARGRRVCRACKLLWHHSNKEPLSGEHKNQNTDKTQCVHGHEFAEENTGHKDGHRFCRECSRIDARMRGRAAEAKYRALKKSDPILWAAERRRRRAEQLQRNGWTIDSFEYTWSKQGGKCAICRKDLNLDVKHNGAKAHADHEHVEPPKPREILCGNCNLGLGNFQDSPDLLRVAAAYVEKHK